MTTAWGASGSSGGLLLCIAHRRGATGFNQTFNASRLRVGQNVRKLIKDGYVIKKPTKIHSRARARLSAEAKAKGRHTGYGAQGLHARRTVRGIVRTSIMMSDRPCRKAPRNEGGTSAHQGAVDEASARPSPHAQEVP